MIVKDDELVNYKSATPMESAEKRAARREWYKAQAWFVEIELAVADRQRFRADHEAAAACAPERTRNFVAGAEWFLAGVAILDALQASQGTDESGTRRAVPASAKFVADLLAVCGFGDGLKAETLDRYAKTLLHLLVESKLAVMVRDAKRVTGDKGDGDAREFLTYFGGRESIVNEPHAEPRSWKKAKLVEQPRAPREPHPAAEPAPTEYAKRIDDERKAWAAWDAAHTPTEAAIRFKQEDAAECAETKFRAAGQKPNPSPRNEARGDGRVSRRASTGGTSAVRPPQKSEPSRPSGLYWLGEIAAGRVTLAVAIQRGMVPVRC